MDAVDIDVVLGVVYDHVFALEDGYVLTGALLIIAQLFILMRHRHQCLRSQLGVLISLAVHWVSAVIFGFLLICIGCHHLALHLGHLLKLLLSLSQLREQIGA